MPTEAHKEKWRDFEVKLNTRANISFVLFVVTNLIWVVTGNTRVVMSQKYLDSGICECNEKLSYQMLPYLLNISIFMNIFRILCIIISYWRPGICKYYLLLQSVYVAVRETAPINLG